MFNPDQARSGQGNFTGDAKERASHATKVARERTQAARSSNRKSMHVDAAKAHDIAAQRHAMIGNGIMTDVHQRIAAAHRQCAENSR